MPVKNTHFNPEEFYKRQVVMPELGREGQEKLRKAKAVVVGLGGLGTASTTYLTLAGVGYIRLVDQDTVELNNLHRQVLYNHADLKYPKVEVASKRIRQLNPEVDVEPIAENVEQHNVEKIVGGMDVVVDGLDNMKTRYVVNRACASQHVPYVFGAALGIEGNLSVFHPPETPCLECVLPSLDDSFLPSCDERGVLGATPGIIGTMQAMETIKLLTGVGETLKGKLMICDFSDMYFVPIEIMRNPECPACGEKPKQPAKIETKVTWLCGQNTVNINPRQPLHFTLDEAQAQLEKHFKTVLKSAFVYVFKYNGAEVSLFNNGRMLIKNVETEEKALIMYNDVMDKLRFEKT